PSFLGAVAPLTGLRDLEVRRREPCLKFALQSTLQQVEREEMLVRRRNCPPSTAKVWLWSPIGPKRDHNHTFAAGRHQQVRSRGDQTHRLPPAANAHRPPHAVKPAHARTRA